MNEKFKIRIVQPNVGPYRVALYEGLGRIYGDRIEVLATDGAGTPNVSQPLQGVRYDYSHPIKKFGKIGWQRDLSLDGMTKGDVLIISGEPQNITNVLLAIAAKIRGISVIWWGHHRSATSREFRVRIRLLLAKMLSDIFLCYTKSGRDYLITRGFDVDRVFATWNTIDLEPIKRAREYWTQDRLSDFRARQNVENRPILLLCSALRPKTRLDLLIQALGDSRLAQKDPMLVVIGVGPKEQECRALAKELKVDDNIMWLGPERDQMKLAPWFLSASMYVYPGAVGLGIIHSLAYGLPVVVHENANHQMPEFEVMENGKTGVTFKENDVSDMAEKILKLLDEPEECKRMGDYSIAKVFSQYSMDQMIKNYSAAIEAAHRVHLDS